MSEFKAMKFWIGDDPELSEKVQRLLFGLGYSWFVNKDNVANTESSYIYASRGGELTHSDNGDRPVDGEEINIDWMRTKKPESIELNGKTYIKSELEEALRHIKPIGE